MGRYLTQILGFVFKRAFRMLDVAGALLPPVAAMLTDLLGPAWSVTQADDLALLAGYGVVGILALRLLSAPYFVWREDQEKLRALEADLAKVRAAPKERVQELLAQDRRDAAAITAELRSRSLGPHPIEFSLRRIGAIQRLRQKIYSISSTDRSLGQLHNTLEDFWQLELQMVLFLVGECDEDAKYNANLLRSAAISNVTWASQRCAGILLHQEEDESKTISEEIRERWRSTANFIGGYEHSSEIEFRGEHLKVKFSSQNLVMECVVPRQKLACLGIEENMLT